MDCSESASGPLGVGRPTRHGCQSDGRPLHDEWSPTPLTDGLPATATASCMSVCLSCCRCQHEAMCGSRRRSSASAYAAVRHISSCPPSALLCTHQLSFSYSRSAELNTMNQSINQSINAKFVGRRYTTRPGAPTVISGKHDQKVHS